VGLHTCTISPTRDKRKRLKDRQVERKPQTGIPRKRKGMGLSRAFPGRHVCDPDQPWKLTLEVHDSLQTYQMARGRETGNFTRELNTVPMVRRIKSKL